jgi:ATP/maltotriose-dependent transcriptional regulator MalT
MDLIDGCATSLRDHGDVSTLSNVLLWQGWNAIFNGDYDRAEHVLTELLSVAATIPDPSIAASMRGNAFANLGVVAHGRGDLTTARTWHESALGIFREHSYALGAVRALSDLGDVARDQGDYTGSVAFYRECLALLGDRGDLRVAAEALSGTAAAAAVWGQPERAARLLGAAEALREQLGLAIVMPTELAAQDRTKAVVRSALGADGLQTAWLDGRELSIASALAEARAVEPTQSTRETAVAETGTVLSPRERDVLVLLAAGHSNRAIAEALFISLPTVKGHVRNILTKLGLESRTAAAAYALRHGLV